MASKALQTFPPDNANYIDDFIDAGQNLAFGHEKYMLKYQTEQSKIVVPMQSLVQKYRGAFRKYIVEYEMTDKEFERWKYNPKRMCKEMYGTPELWTEILFINHMVGITEFKKQTVKLYTLGIIDAINELLMIYKMDIADNRASLEEVD
jgi:hypothetical protein